MEKLTLMNNVEIPVLGFGTWQVKEGEQAYESVKYALECGYRHIDTASGYGNEKSVGRAIQESGIDRRELFITTKLSNLDHGYENTVQAFKTSLSNLGLSYVDLYLIHWPNPIFFRDDWKQANAGTWKAFESFYTMGQTRSIGVSNFCERHLNALLDEATIAPQVNQIRLFPGEQQSELVKFCKSLGMAIEAYSPLGTGKIFSSLPLQVIARSLDKSVAQVCIRYCLQKGNIALVKSVTPLYMQQNLEVFDFSLDSTTMKIIDSLENICGLTVNPDEAEF